MEFRFHGAIDFVPCRPLSEPSRLIARDRCDSSSKAGGKDLFRWKTFRERFEGLSPGVGSLRQRSSRAVLTALFGASSRAEGLIQRAGAEIEELVKIAPEDAVLLTDLAGVRFLLALTADDPFELVKALDSIEQAHSLQPTSPEILFNRALILDRLHLVPSAREAWERAAIAAGPGSWRNEARERRERLVDRSATDVWEEALPMVERSVSKGDLNTAGSLVALAPELARDYALEKVMGAWADRYLAGDRIGAGQELSLARALGRCLFDVSGEGIVSEVVSEVDREQVRPNGAELLRLLALGLQAYRDGRQSTPDVTLSLTMTGLARRALGQAGSPLALWALVTRADLEARFPLREYSEKNLSLVLASEQARRSPALRGAAQEGMAELATQDGTAEVAHQFLLKALASYERVKAYQSKTRAMALLAENRRDLGLIQAAWAYRQSALSLGLSFLDRRARRALLMNASSHLSKEGLFHAALAYLNDDGIRPEDPPSPAWAAEETVAKAKVYSALGLHQKAAAVLIQSRREVRAAAKGIARQRLVADLLLTEAAVKAGFDSKAAMSAVSGAIKIFEELRLAQNLGLSLVTRARIAVKEGRIADAELDYGRALELLESPASRIESTDSRISYSDSVQETFDEMIGFYWSWKRSPLEALATLERARRFRAEEALHVQGSWNPTEIRAFIDFLPANRVVVEYGVLGDRFVTWVLRRGGVEAFETPLPGARLRTLVREARAALVRRRSPDESYGALERLGDLLIPASLSASGPEAIVHFIPDKTLAGVPFAALRNPSRGTFLIEEHLIAVSPSLRHLAGLAKGEAVPIGTPSALLVGNPAPDPQADLPVLRNFQPLAGAQEEIRLAAQEFGHFQALTGRRATGPRLMAMLDGFDVLIFAGHAISDPVFPSRSYLVVAPAEGTEEHPPEETNESRGEQPWALSASPIDSTDSRLTGQELAETRFHRLRTVVLSACNTLGSRGSRSLGLAGMTQPFLDAGVKEVVGSLWEVSDREAAGVLQPLYKKLAEGGSALEGLREAQLEAIHDPFPGRSSIRTWAAFEVTGF